MYSKGATRVSSRRECESSQSARQQLPATTDPATKKEVKGEGTETEEYRTCAC